MRPARGFTYLGVLFVVALIGIGLAVLGQAWHTQVSREREAELLWTGEQYKKAIAQFYLSSPGNARYPHELAELLKDPRRPDTRRYLRKLYPDPVTGKSEWGLVKTPDGGIAGVYSQSDAQPFKTTGFKLEFAAFDGREKYSEWQFVFVPGGAVLPLNPAGLPVQPATNNAVR